MGLESSKPLMTDFTCRQYALISKTVKTSKELQKKCLNYISEQMVLTVVKSLQSYKRWNVAHHVLSDIIMCESISKSLDFTNTEFSYSDNILRMLWTKYARQLYS